MREVMTNIENVRRGRETLAYLLSRPRSEMVGLGLIYGAPGTGKTRFAMRTAFGNGYIYLRLDATMTQRSFLVKLLTALRYQYSLPGPIKGATSKLYNEVVELMIIAPDTVIMIDEIDYGFRNKGLLGTIRDIVDDTIVTVVLIGMQDAKASLLKANAHYFDRCNSFCEFRTLSLDDTAAICKEACEVELDKEVCVWLHRKSGGTVRKLVKLIDWCERLGRERGKKKIAMGDIDGQAKSD